MKKVLVAAALITALTLSGCASDTPFESNNGVNDSTGYQETESVSEDKSLEDETQKDSSSEAEHSAEVEEGMSKGETESAYGLYLTIDDTPVEVSWEDNESVDELKELAADEPLTIQMSMYGGFEQVGSLGTSFPRDDVQMTTSAGDIVLYSGDQIVVFYGSNSWAYTRLGKITDKTVDEMTGLLGNGDVEITISVQTE